MNRSIFVLITLLFCSVAYSAEVSDLYQSQSQVSSREAADRQALLPQLLRQVLVKIVGDEQALAATDLTAAMADSQKYVQQYRYERINTLNQDLTSPDQLALVVNFNQSMVNQLINQLGLPVWGRVRPDVMVWLAYQEQQQSGVVGLENGPAALIQSLTQAAKQRGLPVEIPLMDSQDQTQLTFNDIWQGDYAGVERASSRYGANLIVAARLSESGGKTQIRWQAEMNGAEQRWSSEGNAQQAMTAGINELTDRLARNYTQVLADSSMAQNFMISVSNVLSYTDFTKVMEYLKRLDTITDVRVLNLDTEKLDLDIRFKGEKHILQRTLALGRLLVDEQITDGTGMEHYRLAP